MIKLVLGFAAGWATARVLSGQPLFPSLNVGEQQPYPPQPYTYAPPTTEQWLEAKARGIQEELLRAQAEGRSPNITIQ